MTHAQKLLNEATALHQTGRLDEAEKAYRKLLRVEAVNIDGLRLLGGLYLQTGQMAQAVQPLEKAARLRPQDVEILTNLGIALRASGRVADAEARYRQALACDTAYTFALTNLASLYQDTGRVDEARAAFARVVELRPNDAVAHYNYGNILYVSGKLGEAVAHYEQALTLKPDYIEAMVNLGMVLSHFGAGNQSRDWLRKAQSWFEKALAADPNNIVAMNNLGNVLRQQGQAAESIPHYHKALRLKPDYAQAAINLASSLRDIGQMDEAVASCRQALHLMPRSLDAHINLGALMQNLMRHDEAIELFTQALAINPASLDAKWNKALSLMALGHYEEGLALHECGLGVSHMRGDTFAPDTRWNGENFAGKRLLLWCEQGLGDSLQFIRYAALAKLRGGTVVVMCPLALRPLFANCDFIDALPETVEAQDFDLHAPMMSLPYIFGTTVATIPAMVPYLYVSEAKRAAWALRMPEDKGLKVGLVWAGNPRENLHNAHMVDRRRSMSLKDLAPLFHIHGVSFYNLQMGAGAAQIEAFGLQDRLTDLMIDVKDFEDTAALIDQLDLVISVDTSVVHVAGGLGKPVWVLSRFDGCWRWLQNRADSPWYPTARVFGQQQPGDWGSVVERVGEELKGFAASVA